MPNAFVICEGVSLRLCWKTAIVACTGIYSPPTAGGHMTTGNMDVGRRAETIARRAEKSARREDCPTTLGERGGGGAMAIAPPQQPHNAVPLRPVSAFYAYQRCGSTYQATPPASSSSAA